MNDRIAGQWTRRRSKAFRIVALSVLVHVACSGARPQPVTPPPAPPPPPRVVEVPVPVPEPFQVSVVATGGIPIRIGAEVGFRLSSSTAGYGSLYLIDPVGDVIVLAENMPVAAGTIDYPLPGATFTIEANEPVGVNRVLFLVTRDPFDGFSGSATLTHPVPLAWRADRFMSSLDRATAVLPRASWSKDEITVRVEA